LLVEKKFCFSVELFVSHYEDRFSFNRG
jgi:hypothetical protein